MRFGLLTTTGLIALTMAFAYVVFAVGLTLAAKYADPALPTWVISGLWIIVGMMFSSFAVTASIDSVLRLYPTGMKRPGWLKRVHANESSHPLVSVVWSAVAWLFAFAAIFLAASQFDKQFSGLHDPVDAIYFSVITFATVGYGDIVPISRVTKLLVVAEVLIGLAHVVFVFSTLPGYLQYSKRD